MTASFLPPVPWFQDPAEFKELLRLFRKLAPQRVLEIGTFYGGTLWQWINNLPPQALIVSIDLIIPESDPRRRSVLHSQSLWRGWADDRRVRLVVICGDSTKSDVIGAARSYAPYDFIFVDGGHKYLTLQADFDNYYPILREGGIMAIHDIEDQHEPDVGRFWHELKDSRIYDTLDILCAEPETFGIGVIYK